MEFSFSLEEIKAIVNPIKTQGETSVRLTKINGLKEASQGSISFLGNSKYTSEVAECQASLLILPENFDYLPKEDQAVFFCSNPSWEIAKICQTIEKLHQVNSSPITLNNVHSSAQIDPSVTLSCPLEIGAFSVIQSGTTLNAGVAIATSIFIDKLSIIGKNSRIGNHTVIGKNVHIAENVIIGPHVVIEDNVRIGENSHIEAHSFIGKNSTIGAECHIFPRVSVLSFTEIGNRITLHPGCVIGSDGFGFATLQGEHVKIPQIGNVILEDDTDIGSNTTIDRARFASTRIQKGTKIDNLVQIAHNVQIGRNCLIVSQVGIAGSSNIGNQVTIGGQVGVTGHITIGDNTQICAQAGVTKNTAEGSILLGSPAYPYKEAVQQMGALAQLPKVLKKFRQK